MKDQKLDGCFVIMPFEGFTNLWELVIKPAIEQAMLIPLRADDKNLGVNIIMEGITQSIYNAKIVIADLTKQNANVMFELGLALAAKKPVIMLPSDLRALRYYIYDNKNLSALKQKLPELINDTMNMDSSKKPDMFPELKVITPEIEKELEDYRIQSKCLDLNIYPPTADVFLNNKWLGNGSRRLKVYPHVDNNTISAVAVEYREAYVEIEEVDINKGFINIILEERNQEVNLKKEKENTDRRVARWLRLLHKYPNSPVIKTALSQYMITTKSYRQAMDESRELVDLCPRWYLAHNLVGYVNSEKGDCGEKTTNYFKAVINLKPNSFLGYYNLACVSAMSKNYKQCLQYLKDIADNKEALTTFCYTREGFSDIERDKDFKNIMNNKTYKKQFDKFRKLFISAWNKHEPVRKKEKDKCNPPKRETE